MKRASDRRLSVRVISAVLVFAIFLGIVPKNFSIRSFAEEPPIISQTENNPLNNAIEDSLGGSYEETAKPRLTAEEIKAETEKLLLRDKETVKTNSYTIGDTDYEVDEIADAFSRDYALSTGNFTKIVFNKPVNYLKDNKWERIDCSLKDNGEFIAPVSVPQSLQLSANPIETEYLINLKSDKYSLSITPLNIDKNAKTPEIINAEHTKEELLTSDPCSKSTIIYNGIIKGSEKSPSASLEYIIDTYKIKENIVIENGGFDAYTFEFVLKTDAKSYKTDNGIVSFFDAEGNCIYSLSANIMTDAAGNLSKDVSTYVKAENDCYYVSVIADAKWINDEERAFPVKIDPTMYMDYSDYLGGFETAYYDIGDGGRKGTGFYFGNDTYSYFKVKNNALSTIPAFSAITAAYFGIDVEGIYNVFRLTGTCTVKAESISSSWTPSGVANGSIPSIPSNDAGLLDIVTYNIPSQMYVDFYPRLNVTSEIRSNLRGSGNGFAVHSGTDIFIYSYLVSDYVTLEITYTDCKGIEESKSSHTIGLEGAGTAYIKDINGDLVFSRKIAETIGEVMPVAVSMVHSQAFVGTDTDAYYGTGWRPDIIQKMTSRIFAPPHGTAIEYFVRTDGTGKEHTYSKIQNTALYVSDENPLETYNSSLGLLTFSNGSSARFNTSGWLCEIENAFGDSINIDYSVSTPKILKITDGSEEEICFSYSNTLLSSVYINSHIIPGEVLPPDATTFTYSSGKLTGMNYGQLYITNFSYNSSNCISSFSYRKPTDSNFREKADIYYENVINGVYPVSNIIKSSYSTRTDIEDYINIYHFGDRTEYEYRYGSFSANVYYTENICFDSNGRTSLVLDSYGNISEREYAGGNLSQMNLIAAEKATVSSEYNYVKDFSEKTSGWTVYSVSGSGGLYSASSDASFENVGGGSTFFNLYSTSNAEIYAKYAVPDLDAGKTYTLSAYVDSRCLSGSGGLSFGLYYVNTSGVVKKILSPVNKTGDSKISFTFEAPSDARTGTEAVLVGFKNMNGDMYFDLVELVQGSRIGNGNIVKDSGFLSGFSAWTLNGYYSPRVEENEFGRFAVIPGHVDEERNLTQNLNITGKSGAYLVVNCLAKGHKTQDGFFGISINYKENNTQKYDFIDFDEETYGWQFVSYIFKLKDNFSSFSLSLIYEYSPGDAYFGGLSVRYIEGLSEYNEGSAYGYDDFGRMISERGFSGGFSTYEYVDGNQITDKLANSTYVDRKRNKTYIVYLYQSETSHIVIETEETYTPHDDPDEEIVTVTNYWYNQNGNLTDKITQTNGVQTSNEYYGYSNNGRFLTSVYSSNGVATEYEYTSEGYLSKARTKKATGEWDETSYTYDEYGRQISVSSGGASVDYEYNPNSTKISQNNFKYGIYSDNKGNMTSVKIESTNGNVYTALAGYEYNGEFGQISKLTYGNGQTKYYSYDDDGRLSYVSDTANATKNTAKYTWDYDEKGNVIQYTDRSNPNQTVTTEYSYTSDGDVKYAVSSNGNGLYYNLETNGNIHKTVVTGADNTAYSFTYLTDELDRTKTVSTNGVSFVTTYDRLGRTISKKTLTGSSLRNTEKTYEYKTVTSPRTYGGEYKVNNTSFVTKESTLLSSVPELSYTYYDNGNVKTIKEGSSQISYYEYDTLGQLVREDNKKLNNGSGLTIVYDYDNSGNIRTKYYYLYSPGVSTGGLSNLDGITDYSYSSTIGDRLTSYGGGSTITYDGVGNPLHYNNGTSYNMTWTMGNRLATVSKGSYNTSSYVYDSDGLRTEKTVVDSSGTSRTKYFWEGNVLQSETHENEGYSIIYVYDSDGQAVGFYYKTGLVTAFYRYVRNIFGDVTHIINENCQIEAVYTYDSWGKLLSIKNGSETNITNSKTSIGYRNSLRYRGYYYDTETGFYYLQSRYYDPEVGRFINADGYISTGIGILGYNMYAYCMNNPVNLQDPSGEIAITTLILIGSIVAGCLVAGHTAATSYKYTGKVDVGNTILAGVGTFLTVYTWGMSAYAAYLTYCDYKGYAPVTEIGSSVNNSSAPVSQFHGNSSQSAKPQHGYEIYNKQTGDVVKTGISGQPLNQNGTSPRANIQVNAFNKLEGDEVYAARIVEQNIPGRAAALEWERNNTQILWDMGNSLSKHIRPNPMGR